MLCFVDHPGSAVVEDLSDNDDEVDDDNILPGVGMMDLRLGVIL
ncbi:hypothetical protein A2U01_0110077, partial [Trifolium medium]|nr:hypothetical protein [Trifolium medium]